MQDDELKSFSTTCRARGRCRMPTRDECGSSLRTSEARLTNGTRPSLKAPMLMQRPRRLSSRSIREVRSASGLQRRVSLPRCWEISRRSSALTGYGPMNLRTRLVRRLWRETGRVSQRVRWLVHSSSMKPFESMWTSCSVHSGGSWLTTSQYQKRPAEVIC